MTGNGNFPCKYFKVAEACEATATKAATAAALVMTAATMAVVAEAAASTVMVNFMMQN